MQCISYLYMYFIFTYKWVLRHLSWIDWWLSRYIVTCPVDGSCTTNGAFYSHPRVLLYIVWNQTCQFQITKIPCTELNPWADPKMMIPRSSFEELITNIYWYIVCYQEPSDFLGQKENPPRTHHPGSLHLELNFQCELTSDPSWNV